METHCGPTRNRSSERLFETSDAKKDSRSLRRLVRGAFCCCGGFAADGGVSDFGARRCDDAFQRRGWKAGTDSIGILARGVWFAAAEDRTGNFGGRGALDGGRRISSAAAKSAC